MYTAPCPVMQFRLSGEHRKNLILCRTAEGKTRRIHVAG